MRTHLKKMNAMYIFLSLTIILIPCVWSGCPIEEDPTSLARCIQIDVTAIIFAAKGKEDITALCQLADRYMECIKTYSRGCTGYYVKEYLL